MITKLNYYQPGIIIKKIFGFKCALLTAIIRCSQDTSGIGGSDINLKKESDTPHPVLQPYNRTSKENSHNGMPHASVTLNTGTVIPNTTTGTINSQVNPNTQLAIPINKRKKKSSLNINPGSGITPQ